MYIINNVSRQMSKMDLNTILQSTDVSQVMKYIQDSNIVGDDYINLCQYAISLGSNAI